MRYYLHTICGSASKESACNAGALGWERPPGKGKGYPVQYDSRENSMRYTWVAKSRTRMSDFHYVILLPPSDARILNKMVFHRVMELCDPITGGHGSSLQYSCLEDPHGQRSLVACSLWGLKELNISERLRAHIAVSPTSFSSLWLLATFNLSYCYC